MSNTFTATVWDLPDPYGPDNDEGGIDAAVLDDGANAVMGLISDYETPDASVTSITPSDTMTTDDTLTVTGSGFRSPGTVHLSDDGGATTDYTAQVINGSTMRVTGVPIGTYTAVAANDSNPLTINLAVTAPPAGLTLASLTPSDTIAVGGTFALVGTSFDAAPLNLWLQGTPDSASAAVVVTDAENASAVATEAMVALSPFTEAWVMTTDNADASTHLTGLNLTVTAA